MILYSRYSVFMKDYGYAQLNDIIARTDQGWDVIKPTMRGFSEEV
jgi:hypothetical protein